MKRLLGFVFALLYYRCCSAEQYSRYHYEEQFLAKLVRLEFRLDLLEKKANTGEKHCEHCPDGWIQNKGSCYLVVENKLQFNAARANCQKLQADLVHIENEDENTFLKNHLRTLKGIDFWIGLTDIDTEGVFRWVDDNSRPTFTDWYRFQPDNGGNEDCVHFKAIWNLQWNDRECHSAEKSICEKKISIKG